MSKLKPNRSRTRGRTAEYLGIDIDPQGIFVVAGSTSGTDAGVEQLYSWVPGEDHGPPPLTPQNAAEIGQSLRRRLDAAGIARAPALVAIGREKVILADVRYPAATPSEEPQIVRFQALKAITESGDDVVLDYTPIGAPSPDPTADRRATVVAVRKEVFEAVRTLCVAAGLKLAAVTARPFAVSAGLVRAIETGEARALDAPDDAVAALTLGPQGGEFTVVREGVVTFTRAIPGPVMANETLLIGEVKRNLTVYGGQNASHPVRAVYVAESEQALSGWARRLRPGLAVPVHSYDPVAGTTARVVEETRGRYAGAAGLLSARAAGLPINFAAPRQPRAKGDGRRTLLVAGAATALLFLLVGGAFGYNALDNANDRLTARQQEKTGLEKSLTDGEPDRKRLESVDQWAGREVNYLDELYDMSDRLPPGDQIRVHKFVGTANRVDSKTGKQDGQAKFELYVGAKNADAAAGLVTTIDRDNTKTAKFYTGAKRNPTGADKPTIPHNQLSTIETKVNHRAPEQYSRSPVFTPPRRGAIPLPPPEKPEKTDEKPATPEIPDPDDM